jgi:hypothetical protein
MRSQVDRSWTVTGSLWSMRRRLGSVDGPGSRPAADGRPRAGVDAQAASGSRSWCRRRGCTARPWRPPRGPWPGRRRAVPRTAPAAPPSAVPGQGRAKSPPTQAIEHQFEDQSSILRTATGATLSLYGRVAVIPRSGSFARTFSQPQTLSRPLTDPAVGAGEVPIDRGPADPERVGNRQDRVLPRCVHLLGHPQLMPAQHRRPATVAAPGPGRSQPGVRPLTDQVAFELGQGREDWKTSLPPGWWWWWWWWWWWCRSPPGGCGTRSRAQPVQ